MANPPRPKQRVDQLLVDRGLAPTRARAQALVLGGRVFSGEARVDKPGALLRADAPLDVRGDVHPYVSRGGVKLAGALDTFALDPSGLRCLDVGASTGGFTDCLLQRGAAHVVAVDVGYGQLAQKLREDPRVTNLERTNARTLRPEDVGGPFDLVVVDASFIGLAKLADAVARCVRPGGRVVALVKPQFEVGRAIAAKGRGVVRDAGVRRAAIDAAAESLVSAGFTLVAECDSPIAGPKGNVEAFVLLERR
jgi:23S rRNA (cytidine1920-2'-O)/16S rRNA (cytidine1409-2'-O)-methyltransferase